MRRKDREITNEEAIRSILDRAKILRLGLFDEGYPYVVPLHFGYEYEGGRLTLCMHCAKEGRKLDLIRRDPHVCVEMDCDAELVSGGDVPCKYGSYFASVIGRGTAEIVEDEAEKIKCLGLLMKNQTGREFTITGPMAEAVAVIRVDISELTAKARVKAE